MMQLTDYMRFQDRILGFVVRVFALDTRVFAVICPRSPCLVRGIWLFYPVLATLFLKKRVTLASLFFIFPKWMNVYFTSFFASSTIKATLFFSTRVIKASYLLIRWSNRGCFIDSQVIASMFKNFSVLDARSGKIGLM